MEEDIILYPTINHIAYRVWKVGITTPKGGVNNIEVGQIYALTGEKYYFMVLEIRVYRHSDKYVYFLFIYVVFLCILFCFVCVFINNYIGFPFMVMQ